MLRRLTKSAAFLSVAESRLAEMTAVEVSAALRASHEATAAAEARVSEVEVRVEEAHQASELAAKKAYAAVAAAEARVADLEGEQDASEALK